MKCKKLGNIFRFIDKLAVVNSGRCLEKAFQEIFPHELELEHEYMLTSQAFFSHFTIKVFYRNIALSLYMSRYTCFRFL